MQPNPPRILILSDGMSAGGTERQIVELLGGMRRDKRFRMALGVLDHGGELQAQAEALADVVFPIRRQFRFDATTAMTLVTAIKAAPVSLIHVFGWMSSVIGLIAARSLGIPIINGSIRSALPRLPWSAHITRWCAQRSDAIVANSQAGLLSYRLSSHPQALVIRNGMDWQRFAGIEPQPLPQPSICMVGNFSEYKDQPTLIRAMPAVLRAFPTTHLLLVGRDRGYMNGCSQLVNDLDLVEHVTFITDVSEPLPIVAGSSICVLTSTQGEGISNALIEYMALGKPVIATEGGGNVEIIQHDQTGFLIPQAASEALAQCVLELLRDSDRARRMGERGQHTVRSEFSSERMVAEYVALYENVLGKK